MSLAGCNADFPGKPLPADRPVPQNEITDFATLFRQNCTGCHGADGQHGPAPPLNDPLFLALVTPAELIEVIRNGRNGTPMPAFATEQGGTLTAEQVQILANGLQGHWPIDEEDKAELAALVADAPPYVAPQGSLQLSADATTAGAALFERACAECHGPNGAGGETGYTNGAINDRAFLALISDQALRRIIITGRHDLGMPNYADAEGRPDDFKPLTSEEIDELVALLASWRRDSPSNANAGE
ncbi:cytochrome c [Lacipirellula sp.]|uniref:cytochrome c n=1 Tax=Lacipirellula sp. TaxID=2691419 RepID=UPI003D0A141B